MHPKHKKYWVVDLQSQTLMKMNENEKDSGLSGISLYFIPYHGVSYGIISYHTVSYRIIVTHNLAT